MDTHLLFAAFLTPQPLTAHYPSPLSAHDLPQVPTAALVYRSTFFLPPRCSGPEPTPPHLHISTLYLLLLLPSNHLFRRFRRSFRLHANRHDYNDPNLAIIPNSTRTSSGLLAILSRTATQRSLGVDKCFVGRIRESRRRWRPVDPASRKKPTTRRSTLHTPIIPQQPRLQPRSHCNSRPSR